jgi:hypothetical protein
MDTTLSIKITALVEGLQQVAALGKALVDTGDDAKSIDGVGEGLSKIGVEAEAAGRKVNEAFRGASGRSIAELRAELEKATQALYDLGAGTDQLQKLAVGFGSARANVLNLEEELKDARLELETLGQSDGFDPLSDSAQSALKSIQRLDAELAQAKQEFLGIAQASAGMNEVAVSIQLAQSRVLDLKASLEQAKFEYQAISDKNGFGPLSEEAQDALKSVTDLTSQLIAAETELQTLDALGDPFADTAATAERAAVSVLKLSNELTGTIVAEKKAVEATIALDQQFKVLGGRSMATVKAEIASVEAALEEVKNTAGVTGTDIARASDLAAARIRQLNAELEEPAPRTFAERLKDIGQKLREADFEGAIKDINGLTTGLTGLAATAGFVVRSFLVLKAISFFKDLIGDTIQFGQEAAKLAARVETLGVTLNAVGRNAGYSKEELSKAEAQVKAMGITTEATRDSLTKMIQAGIKINEVADKTAAAADRVTVAQALSRSAQDLAVVSGENSSDTLQRMITNIQQMDTMGLRFMGLTVSREASEAAFAASVGKSASALTESEKKQAFLNATVKEAAKLSGVYEESLDTVGKKLGSLKRLQDEFALAVGTLLTPAYGALVDAQSKFNKEAEIAASRFAQTSSSSGLLKDAVGDLAGSISSLLVEGVRQGLEAFEALSRVFKGVSDLVTPVIKGFAVIAESINTLGNTVGVDNLLAKLNPVTGFLNGLALALAIVQDAVVLTFGVGVKVVAAFTDVLGDVALVIGKITSVVNKDLGQSIVDFATSAKESGKSLSGWADELIASTVKGERAVGEFAKSFDDVGTSSKKSSGAFQQFSKEIAALATAQREGKISSEELSKRYDALALSITKSADAGEISTKKTAESANELAALGKQLQAIPNTIGASFAEAAAAAQTSVSQIRTSISTEIASGVNFLEQLIAVAATKNKGIIEGVGSTVNAISTDVLRTFEKYVDAAKNLTELSSVMDKVNDAFKKGVIDTKQYVEALDTAALKFDELLKTQLKTADTKQKIQDLTDTVHKLADSGAITKTQFDAALDAIAEKSTGAKEAVRRLAEESRVLADASLKVAQSRFEVIKAETDVMKSRVGVWVAENKYAISGNELDRLGVEIARLDLAVAEQQLALARVKAKEQQANYDLAISKQRLLNAETALQYDRSNSALQQAAVSAQDLVEKQTIIVDQVKAQVDLQTEQLLKTQETQYVAKGMLDILQTQERTYKDIQGSLGQVETSVKSVSGAVSEWNKVSSQTRATFGQIGGLTPSLQKFESSSIGAGVALRGAGLEAVRLRSNLTSSTDAASELKFSVSGVNSSMQGLSVSASGVDDKMGGLIQSSGSWKASIDSVGQSIGTADGAVIGMSGNFSIAASEADKVTGGAKALSNVLAGVQTTVGAIGAGIGSWQAGVSKYAQALKGLENAQRGAMELASGANFGYNPGGTGGGSRAIGIGPSGGSVASGGESQFNADLRANRNRDGYGLDSAASKAEYNAGFNAPKTYSPTAGGLTYDSQGMRDGGSYQLKPPDDSGNWTFVPDQGYASSNHGSLGVPGVGYWKSTDPNYGRLGGRPGDGDYFNWLNSGGWKNGPYKKPGSAPTSTPTSVPAPADVGQSEEAIGSVGVGSVGAEQLIAPKTYTPPPGVSVPAAGLFETPPVKTIKLDLSMGGSTVSLRAQESDEKKLTTLLDEAQKRYGV